MDTGGTFEKLVGITLGILAGIPAVWLGLRKTWRIVKFEYRSGAEPVPLNSTPTEAELEILQRLRFQGTLLAPDLNSPLGKRVLTLPIKNFLQSPKKKKKIVLTLFPTKSGILNTPTSTTTASSPTKSWLETLPEDPESPRFIRKDAGTQTPLRVVKPVKVKSKNTQTKIVKVVIRGTQVASLESVSASSQTVTAVQIAAEAQTDIPSEESEDDNVSVYDVEVQTEAVGAAARWQRLVYLVRRVSFLRRTKFCLSDYVKNYDGIYLRTRTSSSSGLPSSAIVI
jgi:hypothetical protein